MLLSSFESPYLTVNVLEAKLWADLGNSVEYDVRPQVINRATDTSSMSNLFHHATGLIKLSITQELSYVMVNAVGQLD